MEQIISKEKLEEIKNIKGEVTGDCLKNDLNFILEKEGHEALGKIEAAMENIGYPIKHKDIKLTDIYPIAVPVALIIIIQKTFNYSEADFEEMGRVEAKISSNIIRLFMRYFISFDMAVNNVQRMWRTHYKIGNVSIPDHDRKKGYAVLRIENFKTHIFICQVLKGYFSAAVELVVGKKVTCEETKCIHKGDDYHEFLLRW
jgi:predicted hydrocarbon binding protein